MPSVFRQRAANPPRKRTMAAFGLVSFAIAAVFVGLAVDREALERSLTSMRNDPTGVVIALAAFATAFVLRAVAWRRVLPGLSFGHSLAGIHLSLGANHVLPLRLGEPFRVISVVRRQRLPFEATAASTLTLRAADIVAVVGLGWLIAPKSFSRLVGPWGWLIVGVVAVAGGASWRWMSKVRLRDRSTMNRPGPVALLLTVAAWLFEAVVIWQSAAWAGIELSPVDAVLVTTVAVAAQVVAIAPSGFGTYEAASVAAYAVLGHKTDAALVAALTAHGE